MAKRSKPSCWSYCSLLSPWRAPTTVDVRRKRLTTSHFAHLFGRYTYTYYCRVSTLMFLELDIFCSSTAKGMLAGFFTGVT